MSNDSLRLLDALKEGVRGIAKGQGGPINQFLAKVIADRISAVKALNQVRWRIA